MIRRSSVSPLEGTPLLLSSRVLLLYPLARAPRRINSRATRWRRLLAAVAAFVLATSF
jgi:hypothetical protein